MSYVYTGPKVETVDFPLECDDKYHNLDIGEFASKYGDPVSAHVYVNVPAGYKNDTVDTPLELSCPNCSSVYTTTMKTPVVGRLRIRMIREPWNGDPEDGTYYYDLPLFPNLGWIDTRAMFEKAEKGRPQHWEYKVTGATDVVLSTRFVKYKTDVGEV